MTKAELLALTPADIDFEKQTVTISKTFHRSKGRDIITSPKTKKSNRTIKMPPFLCEEMQEYIKMLYDIKPDERLFTVTKSYLNHEMERGAKQAGVKKIRVHDIRYPNLYKIQTFQRKYKSHNKYRLKRFGFYFYLLLLIPQKSTREPSGFFHFAETFLSFSSSRVASAFAFSSAVMSR